jgi:hypothetical protein
MWRASSPTTSPALTDRFAIQERKRLIGEHPSVIDGS